VVVCGGVCGGGSGGSGGGFFVWLCLWWWIRWWCDGFLTVPQSLGCPGHLRWFAAFLSSVVSPPTPVLRLFWLVFFLQVACFGRVI